MSLLAYVFTKYATVWPTPLPEPSGSLRSPIRWAVKIAKSSINQSCIVAVLLHQCIMGPHQKRITSGLKWQCSTSCQLSWFLAVTLLYSSHFLSFLLWVDRGPRGCYDSPQSALRPATQARPNAQLRVWEMSMCRCCAASGKCVWCFLRALCCIFIVLSYCHTKRHCAWQWLRQCIRSVAGNINIHGSVNREAVPLSLFYNYIELRRHLQPIAQGTHYIQFTADMTAAVA